MKKFLALALALAMALSLVACGGEEAPTTAAPTTAAPTTAAPTTAGDTDPFEALDPVELVAGDATAQGAAGQLFMEEFCKQVETLSNGKLTIDYHPNSELGGDADILRQVQDGSLDITLCQTAPVVSFIPEVAVFDLPMVFAKYEGAKIAEVLNGDNEFHNSLATAYNNAGFELLGFLQNATYRLTTSNDELKDLAAFKGLQIRTMQNDNHMAFWTAIGAEPTPLAWPEVYFALQTGALDAQENAADTCAGANFQEVQKYLSCTNHILYCNQISMNKDNFGKLDPAYQEVLKQAIINARGVIEPQLEQVDLDNKKILTDGGMILTEYDAAFYDQILAVQGVQDLYKNIDAAVGGLGTKLQAELAK